jgi:hypothetical protein
VGERQRFSSDMRLKRVAGMGTYVVIAFVAASLGGAGLLMIPAASAARRYFRSHRAFHRHLGRA